MAIVTTSIGTNARDYSTITLWEADLDNGALYSSGDIAVGECYNDSVFDEAFTIDGGGTVGLASITLTVAEGERHDGTAGSGARIVQSVARVYHIPGSIAPIPRYVRWLEINVNDKITGRFNLSGIGIADTNTIREFSHILHHGYNGRNNDSGTESGFLQLSYDTPLRVHNCIGYNYKYNFASTPNKAVIRVSLTQPGQLVHIYNNTFVGGVNPLGDFHGLKIASPATITNNVICNFKSDSFSGVSTSYNASDDTSATGTGSITNIVTADQFVSIVDGSEDLHLRLDSDLTNVGTDLSSTGIEDIEIDIDGIDRTVINRWSIGAHEGPMTVVTSIGTSSRDYSTMTLWEADLDDTSVYISGDHACGECYNDSVFDESVTINGGGTVGLYAVTLTVAEGERHDGTAGTGARMVSSVTRAISSTVVHAGGFYLNWLEFNANAKVGGTFVNMGDAGTHPIVVDKLIIHNNRGVVAATPNGIRIIGDIGSPFNRYIMNCIVYRIAQTWTGANSLSGAVGISNDVRPCEILNCTVHNITSLGAGNPRGIVQHDIAGGKCTNCVSTNSIAGGTGTGSCFTLSPPSNAVYSYNASSDTTATGTGSLANIVTADQFVSIIEGSEDLRLKIDCDLSNTGTDLSATGIDNIEIDITGLDRTLTDRWSIGAHEGPLTITKSIGTDDRDYSTITLWESDLDSTSVYVAGDVAIGECYNDSVFNEAVVIDGGVTIGLSEITLTVAEGERHDGTAGSGARNVYTGATTAILNVNTASVATHIPKSVEWLEIDGNHVVASSRSGLHISTAGNTGRHCIIHGLRANASSLTGVTFTNNHSGQQSAVHNCIVYDIAQTTRGAYGIAWTTASTRIMHAYNNTIYKVSGDSNGDETVYGIYLATSAPLREVLNNVVCNIVNTGGGTQACFANVAGYTEDYNAASDATATGTNSITNIATADQFISIIDGSEDLHLKRGADCIKSGTDLSGIEFIEFDIDNEERTVGSWDIGADQSFYSGSTVIIAGTTRIVVII